MSHTEDQLASLGKGQKMPLQRDVEGISVPFGKSVTLHEDSVASWSSNLALADSPARLENIRAVMAEELA